MSESEAIIDATCVGSVYLVTLIARHSVWPLSVEVAPMLSER